MDMKKKAWGLDFGTSKSAVTWNDTASIDSKVTDFFLGDEKGTSRYRIRTCLAWDKERKVVGIGAQAEHDMQKSLLLGSNEKGWEFRINFKPGLHCNPENQEAASAFLKKLYEHKRIVAELSMMGGADKVKVVAGFPADWDEDAQAVLLDIVRKAGFPNPHGVPEPVGAAFYYLGGRASSEIFENDVLIIDWGAGTFDMALLRPARFGRSESWGSQIYGGRLFDDLFFQWFLETREEDHRREVQNDKGLATYLMFKSKEIKERFSLYLDSSERTISPDGKEKYQDDVTIFVPGKAGKISLGNFEVSDVNEFEERAGSFRASPITLEEIRKSGPSFKPEESEFVTALMEGRPVDLLAWGRTLLSVGVENLGIRGKVTTILTGGSTKWLWYRSMVKEHDVLGAVGADGKETVYEDPEPDLTIARGLGRSYTIGCHCLAFKNQIENNREAILDRLSESLVVRNSVFVEDVFGILNEGSWLQEEISEQWKDYFQSAYSFYGVVRKLAEMTGAVQSAQKQTLEAIIGIMVKRYDNRHVAHQLDIAAKKFANNALGDVHAILRDQFGQPSHEIISIAVDLSRTVGIKDISKIFLEQIRVREDDKGFWEFLFELIGAVYQWVMSLGMSKEEFDDLVKGLAATETANCFTGFSAALNNRLHEHARSTAKDILGHVENALDSLIELSRVSRLVG